MKTYKKTNVSDALSYAARGWRVFPVHYVREDGTCSCDGDPKCDPNKPGKHPVAHLVPHGLTNATTDFEIIKEWWKDTPWNIGMACGNGRVVVDCEKEFNRDDLDCYLPDTGQMVSTGGGGVHRHFNYKESTRFGNWVKPVPNMDIRSDGGYVLLPPSNHKHGQYKWINIEEDTDVMSEHVAQTIIDAHDKKSGKSSSSKWSSGPLTTGAGDIPDGQRNDVLFREGGSLRARGCNDDEVRAMLVVKNATRCQPPLNDHEVDLIIRQVCKYPPGTPISEIKAAASGLTDDSGLKQKRALDVVLASDVPPKAIKWMWHGRIAMGMTNLLAGDGGVGKGATCMDFISRLTNGEPFPFSTKVVQGRALVLSAEDAAATAIVPRLIAAGADLSKVHLVKGAKGDGPDAVSLVTDVAIVREYLQQFPDIKLLFVDPISSYAGDLKEEETAIRTFLKPLESLAQDFNIAVLFMRHFRKAAGSAKDKVAGHKAWINAARAAMGVSVKDDMKYLYHIKGNYTKVKSSVMFQTVASGYIPPDSDPEDIEEGGVVKIEWLGESEFTADDLCNSSFGGDGNGASGGKLDEAVAWLTARLGEGAVAESTLREEAEYEGISYMTLKRAKIQLHIIPKKHGYGKGSYHTWRLPS